MDMVQKGLMVLKKCHVVLFKVKNGRIGNEWGAHFVDAFGTAHKQNILESNFFCDINLKFATRLVRFIFLWLKTSLQQQ